MVSRHAGPSAAQVLGGREDIQRQLGCGITSAQDWCAGQLHTTRRVWQQWERDERRMHPAFWELFSLKREALLRPPPAAQDWARQ